MNTEVYKFSKIGSEIIDKMATNENLWTEFLKFQGRVFKHNSNVALEFFAQKSDTQFIATSQQWESLGYEIKDGSNAIRFVDDFGNHRDLYDFSQVEGEYAPQIWMIDKETSSSVKSALKIDEKTFLIAGLMQSNSNELQLRQIASGFQIAPKDYPVFKQSFNNTVMQIIAGRLEIGGNNFGIKPDSRAFQMLKNNFEKVDFLTFATQTARISLNQIEQIMKEITNKKHIESEEKNNDISRMGQIDGRTENGGIGAGIAGNSEGGTAQQADNVQNGANGRQVGVEDFERGTDGNEMVSRIPSANDSGTGDMVQIQPVLGNLRNESDRGRTVNDGRTDRQLRNEVDNIYGGATPSSDGSFEIDTQLSDDSEKNGQFSLGLQGDIRETIRGSEPTSEQFREKRDMGTDENYGSGQYSNEGESSLAEDGLDKLRKALNTAETDITNEKTSAENVDVFDLSDNSIDEREVLVSLTTEIEASKILFTKMIEDNDFHSAGILSETIAGLSQQKDGLFNALKDIPITYDDILFLREKIPGYTSVLNLTEIQKAACVKLEKLFEELGEISPFARREKDILEDDESEIPVLGVSDFYPYDNSDLTKLAEKAEKDIQTVKGEIKNRNGISENENPVIVNKHTGWNIEINTIAFSETIHYVRKRTKSLQSKIDKNELAKQSGNEPKFDVTQDNIDNVLVPLSIMQDFDKVIKDSVLLGSEISDEHGKKAKGSMFVHSLYAPFIFKEQPYIAKIEVEHYFNERFQGKESEDKKRLYTAKGIKIVPVNTSFVGLPQRGSSQDVSLDTSINISQLYKYVKHFDKNFYKNFKDLDKPLTEKTKNGRENRVAEEFNNARFADATATLENENHLKQTAETDNFTLQHSENRQIQPQQALKQLTEYAENLSKNQPISSEKRKELLRNFAEKYNLGEVFVYSQKLKTDGTKMKKGEKHDVKKFFIAEKENGKYLLNEELCVLKQGEYFSENRLVKELSQFEKSKTFKNYLNNSRNSNEENTERISEKTSIEIPHYNVGDIVYVDFLGKTNRAKITEIDRENNKISVDPMKRKVNYLIGFEIEEFNENIKNFSQNEQYFSPVFQGTLFDFAEPIIEKSITNDTFSENIPITDEKVTTYSNFSENVSISDEKVTTNSNFSENVSTSDEKLDNLVFSVESDENKTFGQIVVGNQHLEYNYNYAVVFYQIGENFQAYSQSAETFEDYFNIPPRFEWTEFEIDNIGEKEQVRREVRIQDIPAEKIEQYRKTLLDKGYNVVISSENPDKTREIVVSLSPKNEYNELFFAVTQNRNFTVDECEYLAYKIPDEGLNVPKEQFLKMMLDLRISKFSMYEMNSLSRQILYDNIRNNVRDYLSELTDKKYDIKMTDEFLQKINIGFMKTAKELGIDEDIELGEKIKKINSSEKEFIQTIDEIAAEMGIETEIPLKRIFHTAIDDTNNNSEENEKGIINDTFSENIPISDEKVTTNSNFSENVSNENSPETVEDLEELYDEYLQKFLIKEEVKKVNEHKILRDFSDIEEDLNEPDLPEMPENIEKQPDLRIALNDFSERHGLGELNIKNSLLIETLRDGSSFTLGEITSPYDVPHTAETLKNSLKQFEERVKNVSERYKRKEIIAKQGGITELPKAPENLPEIVYSPSPWNKVRNNITAISTLKSLENGGQMSPYHKISLGEYSGWGGVPQVFDENNSQFESQRDELKKLLTPEEYENAKSSTLNSHYTPQTIIDEMWSCIKSMDLSENAKILEPAVGTGNFIRRMPSFFSNSRVTGVELDSITAKIADYLNTDTEILNCGFEETNFKNNSFDLVIGNVPFGNYPLNDPDYKEDWKIHDAFFRKSLDKVAPGGVVAFVTSSGTLDKKNPKIREYLAERADLIGAVRLPNNAFSDAGTKVTADIVFLQKRKTPLSKLDEIPDWCYTVSNDDGNKINSYFVQNPQMVLGKIEKTTHYDMLTCVPFEGADLKKQLAEAMKNIKTKIIVERREKTQKAQLGEIAAVGGVKNFTFTKHSDGKFYYRTGLTMKEVTTTSKTAPQLELLCDLRTRTRNLIDLQKTSIPDEKLEPLRNRLNEVYDKYQKNYGDLHTRETQRLFGEDSDFPLILGLENINPETGKTEKADIFTKRTVRSETIIENVQTVEEALQVSLDKFGKVKPEYMAHILNSDPDIVVSDLLKSGLAFRDPQLTIPGYPYNDIVERSEYLSGNVREKLTFATEQMAITPAYSANIKELTAVIPEDIRAENIEVRMGCPWIHTQDYTKFLEELSGRKSYDFRNSTVYYSSVSGDFQIENSGSRKNLNFNESTAYGTADFSMYILAEKILNQRQIVVKREVPTINPVTGQDTVITVTDTEATRKALEKARIIKEKFHSWIFATPERKEKYERIYNDTFNCLVGREYDGSKLTFTGMNANIELREHQKTAIARATMGGNTLLAHEVGAGKSYEMFASIMKKKQLGLINKACVVVPKALTEQTSREWQKLYPETRLLTVTNEDLSTENKRKLFTARCVTGSYDGVIMSQEQFEKIGMSKSYQNTFLQKELSEITDNLRKHKAENQGKRDYTVKSLEQQKKRLQARLSKLMNPKSAGKEKDNLLEFEQLGFDYLVVDECHAYKNGFVFTKMNDVAGVTSRPSGRAEDMQMKTDYFNTEFGQGHILYATGTPVSNSMTELYVMTRYLRPDLLKKAGVVNFDDWAATFGNVTTELEQTAYDTYKLKTRFSKFANLPELMAIYKEFADIKSAEKLKLPRPDLKGGKPTIVNVKASPEQLEYVKELSTRAEKIAGGNVLPTEDNMLKITSEARLIGLGNGAVKSLYNKKGRNTEDFIETKDGKVDKCVENVLRIYNENEKTKAVQIIFSDIAVNSDNGNFSAYEYLKNELIAQGIPEKEIIFAPKADSKNRTEIFDKINNSEYRVVIASTGTLGTGANIQQNLKALHHLDVPWKPSDFSQREGRILRQGNKNKEVEILNYITEGTLDSYLYATVTNKAKFIAQLLDNEAPCESL
jgi:N12 class adenine-specific DNA methylase/predicted RNA methylase